jgi:hypothetical protein
LNRGPFWIICDSDTVRLPEKQKVAYATKLKIQAYIEEKAAQGLIEYTLIITGLFFDWGNVA